MMEVDIMLFVKWIVQITIITTKITLIRKNLNLNKEEIKTSIKVAVLMRENQINNLTIIQKFRSLIGQILK